MFDAVYFTFFWAHLRRLGRFGALVIACANVSMPIIFFWPFIWRLIHFHVCNIRIPIMGYLMAAPIVIALLYYVVFGRYKKVIKNRKYAAKKYRVWSWAYFLLTFVWMIAGFVHDLIYVAKW